MMEWEELDIKMKESWDLWAEKHKDPYLSVHRISDKRELDIIVQDIMNKLSLKRGEILLDAGCGSGMLLSELIKVGGITGVGMDFSLREIEIAKTHFPFISYNIGRVESIPFSDQSFDKVLCYSVLLYIKDWRPALQELLRVCKEGGLILLGDLPSINHQSKLYWEYLRKVPKAIFNFNILKNLFKYRKGTPWYWMNLDSIVIYLKSFGLEGKILPQPKGHHQYGGATGRYRFDILVRKGSRKK